MSELSDAELTAASKAYASRLRPNEREALLLAAANLARDGDDPLARAALISEFCRGIVADMELLGPSGD